MAFAYIHHSHDERQRAQLDEANWLAYSQALQERVHRQYLDRRFAHVVRKALAEDAPIIYEVETYFPRGGAITSHIWEPPRNGWDKRPTLAEAARQTGLSLASLASRAKMDPRHVRRYLQCETCPGTEIRTRLARALWMEPEHIRFPVRVQQDVAAWAKTLGRHKGGHDDDAA
jgi:AraC-like DNA-binding protein